MVSCPSPPQYGSSGAMTEKMPTSRAGTASGCSDGCATSGTLSPTCSPSVAATASTTTTWIGPAGSPRGAGQVPATRVAWPSSPSRKPTIAWSWLPLVGGAPIASVALPRQSRTVVPPSGPITPCSSASAGPTIAAASPGRAVDRGDDRGVCGGGIGQRPAQAGLRRGRRIDQAGGEENGGKKRDEPCGRDDRPVGTRPMQAHPPPRKQ